MSSISGTRHSHPRRSESRQQKEVDLDYDHRLGVRCRLGRHCRLDHPQEHGQVVGRAA